MLTPNDISSKKFEKSAFGYKPEEVDAFLSEILGSYNEMYQEKTEPILEHYKKQNVLYEVNGEDTVENVFKQVDEIINRD